MASVNLENVTKIYANNVKAVKNINLQILDKEFLVLVGPSGCGKSTLLRMIAGLEEVTEGKITIAEKEVNNVPPKDRNIAMVFQNYALYPHMTVFENMAFGLKLRKYNRNEIKQRVTKAAGLLGLRNLLNRKPKALSGGQRQRVAVGRAIVRKPDVFLFDEPLSNLDAKLRVQMRIEINKLHKRLGATMIYVTHDQIEAMTMGNRIVVMNEGEIQQVDSPLNLYNFPENIFVAGFLGSPEMNFFYGEVINMGTTTFWAEPIGIQTNLLRQKKIDHYIGRKVILGIRPEHLMVKNKPSARGIGFDAKVEVVETMGNEHLVYLKTGKHRCTARCPVNIGVKTGSTVFLEMNRTKIYFFDRDSGQIIN